LAATKPKLSAIAVLEELLKVDAARLGHNQKKTSPQRSQRHTETLLRELRAPCGEFFFARREEIYNPGGEPHAMKLVCFLGLVIGAAVLGRAQDLRAGYAKTDITPTGPVMMGGYDLRDAPSDGVYPHDRLYARALVFEASGVRVAFLEADVIMIQGHDLFRRQISEATGIPESNILLGDVHNHAAPSPNAELKTAWDRQFADGLMKAATQAVANLQPVRIDTGTGHSRIAMNRRQMKTADSDSPLTFDENNSSQSFGKHATDKPVMIHEFGGVVRLGANPLGPIDDAVQIVRLDTADGRPLAVMIHYPCHGTSLGGRNSKISGEWMGHMQDYVEKQFPGHNWSIMMPARI
jgi:neutral ceramidase